MNEFFQTLKTDHEEVKGILKQLKKTNGEDSKKREDLFKKLRKELVPHMKAEESAFYPPLLEKKKSRDDAMEGVEEHHVSELVLKELEKMPKDDDKWGAKVAVFKELVEHHIKEEESALFKSAEKALDSDEIKKIAKQFEQDKKKYKKNLK